jgi:glucose-6-phosphate 1-dehydrogenase
MLSEKKNDGTHIVILGASGDLTRRKLLPSLFHLFSENLLPEGFLITGCGRTLWSHEDFKREMKEAVSISTKKNGERSADFDRQWDSFSAKLHYCHLQYGETESYTALARHLSDLDGSKKDLDETCGSGCTLKGPRRNRVFYIALPPTLYKDVAQGLGESGLATEEENQWVRFVLEKPFGTDLDSALSLNSHLAKYFSEHQIFRIDHYLAKDTVQNILVLRFGNEIFEHLWNRQYVDKVVITAAESLGVGSRAGYYEHSGVLRDMFQNHMLQLLALTAMEPPVSFNEKHVRDEKVKIFNSLRPFDLLNINNQLFLGQYKAGEIDGESVIGYREENGVHERSCTPTYAKMKVFVDNWRWKGVPFYLCSGKRMKEKRTEVAIHFKPVPMTMFRHSENEKIPPNKLILGVYPEQKISMEFQTKVPGSKVTLQSSEMTFCYDDSMKKRQVDAYETVLLDCLAGDQLLFWRQDGVEACWKFMTPILGHSDTCNINDDKLTFYEAGAYEPCGKS